MRQSSVARLSGQAEQDTTRNARTGPAWMSWVTIVSRPRVDAPQPMQRSLSCAGRLTFRGVGAYSPVPGPTTARGRGGAGRTKAPASMSSPTTGGTGGAGTAAMR